jgi:large subunit ribosomal protein L29
LVKPQKVIIFAIPFKKGRHFMAKNTIAFKDLSVADLEQKLSEELAQYNKLKFSHAVSPVENPMTIRHTRREIARLKTELHKRQTAGA